VLKANPLDRSAGWSGYYGTSNFNPASGSWFQSPKSAASARLPAAVSSPFQAHSRAAASPVAIASADLDEPCVLAMGSARRRS
jgi:hypothetical protein